MSMINDALRRASSAAKVVPSGAVPPEGAPCSSNPVPPGPVAESVPRLPPFPVPTPVTPVLPSPPSLGETSLSAPPVMRVEPASKKSSLGVVALALFVLCLGGAGAAYWWHVSHAVPVNATEKRNPEARRTSPAATTPGAVKGLESGARAAEGINLNSGIATAPAPRPAPVAPSTSGSSAPSLPASTAAPLVPVKFPPLRLQSIFYRPANPSVIINGKTLFITDEINGVKVADIQPANVTLVLSGQTNVLTLR